MRNNISRILLIITIIFFYSCEEQNEIEESLELGQRGALEDDEGTEGLVEISVFTATKETDRKYSCFVGAVQNFDANDYYPSYTWKVYRNGSQIMQTTTGTISVFSFDLEDQMSGSYNVKLEWILNPYDIQNNITQVGDSYSGVKNLEFSIPYEISGIGPDWVFSGGICAWENSTGDGRLLPVSVNGGQDLIPGATYQWSFAGNYVNWGNSDGRPSRYLSTNGVSNVFPKTFQVKVVISKDGYESVERTRNITINNCVFYD